MTTFTALLRGINVGKAKRIRMAELRSLLTGLGYKNVATLLNSGNVVFHAPGGAPARHAARIATAIAAELEIEVPVIVKSAAELAAVVSENPLVEKALDHSRLVVAFTQDNKTLSALGAIGSLVASSEQFVIGKSAAYLNCAGGILDSKAGSALLGKAGKAATTRNWATVLKLHALASETDC